MRTGCLVLCLFGLVLSVVAGVVVALDVGGKISGRPRTSREYVTVVVGSKEFPESVLLGEIVAGLARHAGADDVRHLPHAGGTSVLWHALVSGQIDVYVDYTGTILREIYSEKTIDQIRNDLQDAARVTVSRSLGFENSYAIAVREEVGIRNLSELKDHRQLQFGLSREFLSRREDGFKGLQEFYDFEPLREARKMSHNDVYRALMCPEYGIDAVDLYTTDPQLHRNRDKITLLKEGDRKFFPKYEGVLVYRTDLRARATSVVDQMSRLVGKISTTRMRELNLSALAEEEIDCSQGIEAEAPPESAKDLLDTEQVNADRFAWSPTEWRQRRKVVDRPIYELDEKELVSMNADLKKLRQAAKNFLQDDMGVVVQSDFQYWSKSLMKNTNEHLILVVFSLLPAVFLGLIWGSQAAESATAEKWLPKATVLIWLIPPPAALGLMRWVGAKVGFFLEAGAPPALLVLLFFALLPILDHAARAFGPQEPPPEGYAETREDVPLLTLVEGIRRASALVIGIAILGTLVDAGGYGGPIRAAIRFRDPEMALNGALPAIVMALVVWLLFKVFEGWLRQSPKLLAWGTAFVFERTETANGG